MKYHMLITILIVLIGHLGAATDITTAPAMMTDAVIAERCALAFRDGERVQAFYKRAVAGAALPVCEEKSWETWVAGHPIDPDSLRQWLAQVLPDPTSPMQANLMASVVPELVFDPEHHQGDRELAASITKRISVWTPEALAHAAVAECRARARYDLIHALGYRWENIADLPEKVAESRLLAIGSRQIPIIRTILTRPLPTWFSDLHQHVAHEMVARIDAGISPDDLRDWCLDHAMPQRSFAEDEPMVGHQRAATAFREICRYLSNPAYGLTIPAGCRHVSDCLADGPFTCLSASFMLRAILPRMAHNLMPRSQLIARVFMQETHAICAIRFLDDDRVQTLYVDLVRQDQQVLTPAEVWDHGTGYFVNRTDVTAPSRDVLLACATSRISLP